MRTAKEDLLPTHSAARGAVRAWAKGNSQREAGVELLITGSLTLYHNAPWIKPEPAREAKPVKASIDTRMLLKASKAWIEEEQALVTIAISLLNGGSINLAHELPRLKDHQLGLVLLAVVHASTSPNNQTLTTNE